MSFRTCLSASGGTRDPCKNWIPDQVRYDKTKSLRPKAVFIFTIYCRIMAVTRAKKEQAVSKLSKLFKKADLVVFMKFRKLSVAKVSELRKKLREAGASYTVAKKRLARLVLKQEGVDM